MHSNHDGAPITTLLAHFQRFYPYTRPDLFRMLINLGLQVVIVVVGATLIWTVGRGFDALNGERFDTIFTYLAVFCVLVVLLQGLRYASQYLYEWMQQRIICAIRRDVYAHLLQLATPSRGSYSKGDVLTRLSQDIVRISELLVVVPGHLFAHGLTCLIYAGVLLYIDVTLALIALVLTPLLWLHQRLFAAPARRTSRNFLAWQGRMGAFEEQSLSNLEGIASFTAAPAMLSRFDQCFGRFRQAAMKNLLMNNAFVVSFELLIVLLAIILIAIGIYSIDKGDITIGDLVNFLLYVGYLASPLRNLAKVPIESQIRAGAAERVTELFDCRASVQQRSDAISLSDVAGGITFRQVDFAYSDGAQVLTGFSLDIAPKEYVAIVGPSGVGKSTLARLLQRFYDPQSGEILLDGVDLRQLNLQWLRRQIAVVSQHPFLIDDTVYNNLCLANPDATQRDVVDALQSAHALEFVNALAQGVHTRLDDQGVTLSSGQRQRLSIAQALLKEAPIVVLDEATSALDSHSEREISNAIQSLRPRCTVIVIAHWLATVVDADRIVYLSGSEYTITGTHRELMACCDEYRQAVQLQRLGAR